MIIAFSLAFKNITDRMKNKIFMFDKVVIVMNYLLTQTCNVSFRFLPENIVINIPGSVITYPTQIAVLASDR